MGVSHTTLIRLATIILLSCILVHEIRNMTSHEYYSFIKKKLKSLSLKSALFSKKNTHKCFLLNTIEYQTYYVFLELGCAVLEPEWRS